MTYSILQPSTCGTEMPWPLPLWSSHVVFVYSQCPQYTDSIQGRLGNVYQQSDWTSSENFSTLFKVFMGKENKIKTFLCYSCYNPPTISHEQGRPSHMDESFVQVKLSPLSLSLMGEKGESDYQAAAQTTTIEVREYSRLG